jgi:hypothetical protein
MEDILTEKRCEKDYKKMWQELKEYIIELEKRIDNDKDIENLWDLGLLDKIEDLEENY